MTSGSKQDIPSERPGIVITWTARYLDANLVEQTCTGTFAPATIRSGLDRTLRINQSLAAIKLSDPETRVRRVLGPPARITRPYSSLRIYNYRAWRLQVWFYAAGGRWNVQSVRTTSRAFRTDRGVGVGMSFTTLRRRHGGFACFLDGNVAFQLCLKRQLAPRPTTIFNGTRGRITSIALTLMGD